MGVWGLFDLDRLVACGDHRCIEDRRVVVWSMATRTESQKRGYGRRLLNSVLVRQSAAGVAGSLLQSSAAGEQPLSLPSATQVVEYWASVVATTLGLGSSLANEVAARPSPGARVGTHFVFQNW